MKKIFLKEALENDYILFFEHDPDMNVARCNKLKEE